MGADAVLKRDRAIVISGIVCIAAISWAYMLYLGWGMDKSMGMEMAMPRMQGWETIDFVLMFVMWAVMMVAMMTPSATPMILTFSRINRTRHERGVPLLQRVHFSPDTSWSGPFSVPSPRPPSGDFIAPPSFHR